MNTFVQIVSYHIQLLVISVLALSLSHVSTVQLNYILCGSSTPAQWQLQGEAKRRWPLFGTVSLYRPS